MQIARVALVPVLAATVALAGCGASSSGSSSSATSPSSVSSPASGSTSAGTAASACPTSNTRSFAKTRFVGDVGAAAGLFHRYIYKPYQAGSFKKGAHGRTLALIKAGGTAAADVKLVKNASENVKASPALCKALYKPMTQLGGQLEALKGQITSGDLTSVAGVEGLVSQVVSGAKSHGLPITETTSAPSGG